MDDDSIDLIDARIDQIVVAQIRAGHVVPNEDRFMLRVEPGEMVAWTDEHGSPVRRTVNAGAIEVTPVVWHRINALRRAFMHPWRSDTWTK